MASYEYAVLVQEPGRPATEGRVVAAGVGTYLCIEGTPAQAAPPEEDLDPGLNGCGLRPWSAACVASWVREEGWKRPAGTTIRVWRWRLPRAKSTRGEPNARGDVALVGGRLYRAYAVGEGASIQRTDR